MILIRSENFTRKKSDHQRCVVAETITISPFVIKRGDRHGRWSLSLTTAAVNEAQQELSSCSKYSLPKSTNSTTLSLFPLFFPDDEDFRFNECCFLSATTGEHHSSPPPDHAISRRDSRTRSTGKLSTAMEPRIAKAAWS